MRLGAFPAVLFAAALASAQDEPKYQADFPPEELIARRVFLLDFIGDEGDYRAGPLVAGQVFSVDPMLWVHEEKLYVRMEDVVLVTETGVENFTDFMPSEIEEIEALMREEGILQMRPAEALGIQSK